MCSVYSLPIAKILKIKFINGIIRNAPSINNISKRSLFYRKITYSFSDFILSNSYAGLRSYNSPRLKSICIYNGFDFNRIKNIKEKQNVINEHNIRTEKIVGMVARFHKSKDYYTYIMSGIKIIQKRNDVTFLAIGDGDTFKQCVELVPQKYNDNIRFLGNQKDVESIINIFDIGVLTTYTEGISNSIMEYMALGKPVVATKNEGNAEIVQDNRTGFLVTPRDISALTEKIDFLLNNNNIAINMGINGKKRLEKEFNLEKMTDAHIKIYEQCLRNSNRLNGIESI